MHLLVSLKKMISKLNLWRRSLSTRLLIVFVFVAIVLAALTVVTIIHVFARAWEFNARPHIELYLDYISEDIGNPPSQDRAIALSQKLPVEIYIENNGSQFSTNNERLNLGEMYFHKPGLARHGRFANNDGLFKDVEFGGDEDRTLMKRVVGDYQVYYELQHKNDRKERRGFIVPVLLALLASMALLFFVIRRMLLPVNDIRQGVMQMGNGNLDHRIKIRRNNDLGTLATSINTMASDIENMLDSKRQLLLGASHELRSPLTRAMVATSLLPESSQRQHIEDDLKEMEMLIASILESERMKSGHAILDKEKIELEQLITSVLTDMQAEGVIVDVPTNMPLVSVDKTRIGILIRNLVGNAITHSVDSSSPVSISAKQVGDNVQLVVSDKGQGIPAEHVDKVTEPFYRTDESRTRQTGGFGLGLHLAKLIAEAHGGSLRIESRTQAQVGATGTDVIVSLPL